MLNAFRHHGLYRSASSTMVCTAPMGAQRLSASRIISDDLPGSASTRRRRVLNAFRHHGLYRSIWLIAVFGSQEWSQYMALWAS